MKYNFQIIEEHLNKKYNILFSQNDTNIEEKFVEQLIISTKNTIIEENRLYICEDNFILKNSKIKNYMVISIGHPNSIDLPSNYIAIDKNTNIIELYNYLAELFAYCTTILDNLLKSMVSESSLENLLKIVSNEIGNPIYLMDIKHKMIAMADDGTNAKIFSGSNWISNGTIVKEFASKIENSHDYDTLFKVKGRGYWIANKDSYLKYNYLFYNFFINNFFSGRMVIYESNKKLNKLDIFFLDHLFKFTEITIKKMDLVDTTKKTDVEIILNRLINGIYLDENKLSSILSNINWKINDNFYCFSLELKETDFIYKTIISLINTIKKNIQNCVIFKKDKNLCGIVKIKDQRAKDNSINHLKKILLQYSYHIGFSSLFSNLKDLSTFWKMATLALSMKDFDSDNYIHQFDKLIISYLIRKTCDDFSFSILCPLGLKELIKYDNLHNSELLTTLKVYLANDRKQKKSSEILFIHRSSLLSRIDKIIEITNCDFEDTDQRLLYFVLIRYYQKLQKDKEIANKK